MHPQSLRYRSPVYRKLLELDADFAEINGYAVAMAIGDLSAESIAARHLALCDCSGLTRIGFKGPGAIQWIAEQGITVPDESNRALRQHDGTTLARLAPREVFILGDIDQQSPRIDRLKSAWQSSAGNPTSTPRGFILPRQDTHAWFRLSGANMAAMLAKLCGIDLREGAFADLRVAQTSVARLNAIVIRQDVADTSSIDLLTDSASATYFWDCLLDAGREFNLQVIGLNALRALIRR